MAARSRDDSAPQHVPVNDDCCIGSRKVGPHVRLPRTPPQQQQLHACWRPLQNQRQAEEGHATAQHMNSTPLWPLWLGGVSRRTAALQRGLRGAGGLEHVTGQRSARAVSYATARNSNATEPRQQCGHHDHHSRQKAQQRRCHHHPLSDSIWCTQTTERATGLDQCRFSIALSAVARATAHVT